LTPFREVRKSLDISEPTLTRFFERARASSSALVAIEVKPPVLAVIEEPAAVKKILLHLGLPAVALETARAHGPPQQRLAFDAA